MNKSLLKKIINHHDKDEIIARLAQGKTPKDVSLWLSEKYSNVNEKKFLFTDKTLETFKDQFLDIYGVIQEDLLKTKSNLAKKSEEEQLALTIKKSPAYKDLLIKTAGEELDIRTIVRRLCAAVEDRLGKVFDELSKDDGKVNPRVDEILMKYVETLGGALDKYYKYTEAPAIQNQTINNNITVSLIDEHITFFHDIIREILAQLDTETSLYFIELFNEKFSKLKQPQQNIVPAEMRLAEAKILNETISRKLDNG